MPQKFNGKNGVLAFAGSDFVNLYNWTVTATSTFTEATPMTEEWVTKHRGFVSWTATAETYYAGSASDTFLVNGQAPGYFGVGSDIAHQVPQTLHLYFTDDPTDGYFEGKAFIEGVAPKSGHTDNNTLTWTFRGTSDLTAQA